MPVKYFPVTIDSSASLKPDSLGGGSLGNGQDWHLPIGMRSGYVSRAAIKFNVDFTGMASITSASLYVKTANSDDGTKDGYLRDTHGIPNTGNIKISRITKSWSEGTYGNDETLNGLNSTEWATFATGSTNAFINTTTGITTSGEVTVGSGSTTRGVVLNYSVTDIVRAWAPTSVTGGGGATNYGILIRMATEVAETTGDFIEFYSKQAYDFGTAYGAGTAGTSSDWVGGVNGAGSYIAVTYVEAVTATPSVTLVSPSAGGIAPISNLNEAAEWTTSGQHALPTFTWSTSGGTGSQTSWWLSIYADSGKTTVLYNSGQVTDATHGSDTSFSIPTNANAPSWLTSASGYNGLIGIAGLVNGTTYYWTMEVWDSNGVSSTESGTSSFKVRWGQAAYEWDAGTGYASTGAWSITHAQPPANTQAVVLYRVVASSGGTTGAWSPDMGPLIGTERYLQTLVRMSTDNGTKPYITDISFSYSTNAVPPDNWFVNAGSVILDDTERRFGTKSALWKPSTTGASSLQPTRNTGEYDIPVLRNTRYTFSAYVKPVVITGRTLKLRIFKANGSTASTSGLEEIADVNGVTGSANYASFTADNEGWYRLTYTFETDSSTDFVKPLIYLFGTGLATDSVYVDGVQFEEGTVVRSWTPGFVTQAMTFEGAGLNIDGSTGGKLRLRGSDAGARDIVELGANGLDFGGASPASLYSGSASTLNVTGAVAATGLISTTDKISSSNAGGKTTLALTSTGSNTGLTLGGDNANLYRSSANTLKTDGSLIVVGDITGDGVTNDLVHGITLQRTTALSINTSTDASATAIVWSSAVKNTALYAYWSSGSAITIPLTGWYHITCHMTFASSTGYAARLYALVGSTVIAETDVQAQANTTSDTIALSTIAYLTAADSLVFRAAASTTTKTIGGTGRNRCSVLYLGNMSA